MNENENFAQMLEESFKTLNTGDVVTGTIRSIGTTEITVDLPAKVTGIIPFDEVTDDSSVKLCELYNEGDEISAQAIRVSDVDGIATLSVKKIRRADNWIKIKNGLGTKEVFTGKVTEVVKGGVIVSSNFIKVFVPGGKTGVSRDVSLDTLMGQTVRFRIIDINEERNRAVGSIRDVERDERREERRALVEEFWNNIEVGKVYNGTVKSIVDFGAFIDLGGVDGLVHITELSWLHIKHPSEVVAVGDKIEVFVKSFDKAKKRISLGHKTEETYPWNVFINNYAVGDVVDVTIVSILSYGAFARVIDGIDGLIHISEIADKKVNDTNEELTVGQVVQAKIINIDDEKKKVSLSIRALIAPATEEAAETEEVSEEVSEETAE